MFYSGVDTTESKSRWGFGERMRDVLDVAVALLTLEDDYDVDWELPEDFEEALATGAEPRRPERPLRGQESRRPGALPRPQQPCLSPVPARLPAPRHAARAR